eukprot:Sspe_Gene.89375::Locus_61145_Transcript_2_2_Confidence_0.500_Length_1154::g.89375::m.89375
MAEPDEGASASAATVTTTTTHITTTTTTTTTTTRTPDISTAVDLAREVERLSVCYGDVVNTWVTEALSMLDASDPQPGDEELAQQLAEDVVTVSRRGKSTFSVWLSQHESLLHNYSAPNPDPATSPRVPRATLPPTPPLPLERTCGVQTDPPPSTPPPPAPLSPLLTPRSATAPSSPAGQPKVLHFDDDDTDELRLASADVDFLVEVAEQGIDEGINILHPVSSATSPPRASTATATHRDPSWSPSPRIPDPITGEEELPAPLFRHTPRSRIAYTKPLPPRECHCPPRPISRAFRVGGGYVPLAKPTRSAPLTTFPPAIIDRKRGAALRRPKAQKKAFI